jgi:hypothetical protein
MEQKKVQEKAKREHRRVMLAVDEFLKVIRCWIPRFLGTNVRFIKSVPVTKPEVETHPCSNIDVTSFTLYCSLYSNEFTGILMFNTRFIPYIYQVFRLKLIFARHFH